MNERSNEVSPLTMEHARERAQQVREAAGDPETAHAMLDELWEDVLRVFANDEHLDPGAREVARLALEPLDGVTRWYA